MNRFLLDESHLRKSLFGSPPILSEYIIVYCVSVFQEWNDVNLKWNKSDFGNIQDIRIPPKHIWKPDLLMYNRYNFKLGIGILKLIIAFPINTQTKLRLERKSIKAATIRTYIMKLILVPTKLLTGPITPTWW